MDYLGDIDEIEESLLTSLDDFYYSIDEGDQTSYQYYSVFNYDSMALMFKYCIVPSIQQAFLNFYPLILAAMLIRLLVLDSNFKIPPNWKHMLSTFISLGAMFIHFASMWKFMYLMSLALLAFGLTVASLQLYFDPNRLKIHSIILCGFHLFAGQLNVDKDDWLAIRGAEMILIMKVVSVCTEISSRRIVSCEWPQLLNYFVCIYSSILGPWISFRQFANSFVESSSSLMNKAVLTNTIKYGVFSLLSLCLSNCLFNLIEYSIEENIIPSTYFKAFSYRQSHYFICYLSQFMCSLGNVKSDVEFKKTDERKSEPILVTRQFEIELPRSLVNVVTSWNLTMHFWLKKHVFLEAKIYGTFMAVLTTYFVSSLLHGFDLNIVLVLFSLGLFTYVELNFRLRLSRILNSCVQVKKCSQNCNHKYKNDHARTQLVNLVLVLLNVWHLAYLGQLLYSDSENPSESVLKLALSKWSKTFYSSHLIIIVQFMMYKIFVNLY